MINLIPTEEKKRMNRDFYQRLLIALLVTLSVSFFLATVAIMPSYLLSSVKKNLADEKLEAQRALPMPEFNQDTLAIIQDLNTKMSLIEKANLNKFIVSERVIDSIITKKTPDIKITNITYATTVDAGKTIRIEGFAPSREKLLSFRLSLEKDPNFKSVDLPISNFIKGENIQFNLNLIPS